MRKRSGAGGKDAKKGLTQEYISAAGFQIFKIFGSIFLMSFIYLIVVYFGDNVRNIAQMKPDDQVYFAKSLYYVSLVCTWSGYISIGASAAAFVLDFAYGRGLFVLGAAFAFGLPWLFYYYTPHDDYSKVVYYLPGENIPHYFLNDMTALIVRLGYVMLFVGIILLIRELIIETRDSFRKHHLTARTVKTKKKADFGVKFKCWQTCYCSPEVKKICPAFAVKKNCWKLGTGCCDESLIYTHMASADNKYSQRLKEMLNPHAEEERKEKNCKTCHIYMEHQRYKYRLFFPITILAALAVGYFCYQHLFAYCSKALMAADKFASFMINNNQLLFDGKANIQWVVIFFVVMIVFAIAAAGVALLNYLIYKLKL